MGYYIVYTENNISQSINYYDTKKEAIKEMIEFAKTNKTKANFYNGLEDNDNVIMYIDEYGINCSLTLLEK